MPKSQPIDRECRDIIATLYEFLDGELTDDRRVKVRHHLDRCGSCLEAYEFEAELREVVASRSRERIPVHLLNRLQQIIDEERSKEING